MSKSNNQSNSLDNIKFVQDITSETAANYSGGVGRINDGNNDPDVILYEESNLQGQSIGVNAAVGDGIPNVGANFNDKTSSIKINRGTWSFCLDDGYRGLATDRLTPGMYDASALGLNDKITSLIRVG